MISDRLKYMFVQNIALCKSNNANICTNKKYSEMFGVSERKFSDFITGKNYDLGLLENYMAFHGFTLSLKSEVATLQDFINIEYEEPEESDELIF